MCCLPPGTLNFQKKQPVVFFAFLFFMDCWSMSRHNAVLVHRGALLFSVEVIVSMGRAKHVNQERANVKLFFITMVARLVFPPFFLLLFFSNLILSFYSHIDSVTNLIVLLLTRSVFFAVLPSWVLSISNNIDQVQKLSNWILRWRLGKHQLFNV